VSRPRLWRVSCAEDSIPCRSGSGTCLATSGRVTRVSNTRYCQQWTSADMNGRCFPVRLTAVLAHRSMTWLGTKRPSANTVLTTAVDTWSRPWMPGSPGIPSDLFRRSMVDRRGLGHSPEKRTPAGRGSMSFGQATPTSLRALGHARLGAWALGLCAAELSRTESSGAAARRRARRQRRRSASEGPRGAHRAIAPGRTDQGQLTYHAGQSWAQLSSRRRSSSSPVLRQCRSLGRVHIDMWAGSRALYTTAARSSRTESSSTASFRRAAKAATVWSAS